MEKTVVELFAGVGGFRCGFNEVKLINGKLQEKDTWDFVWANQWEPKTKSQAAFDCYVRRFGRTKNHVNRDIAKIDKSIIPNHTILVGGFPCQDYSVARTLSNEKGIKGKDGELWWQIVEVLEEKKPPFLLLENVDRLLRSPSKQRGRDFGIMLRTLLDNGYSVEWRVINAAEYGFPQKRRRTYIFAYHKTTNYYQKMSQIPPEKLIYHEGIFAKKFPIQHLETDEQGITNITPEKYETLIEVNDNFEFHFYNTGLMHEGKIYTYKTTPIEIENITTLYDVMEKDDVDEEYFLNDEQIEKFKYLKGSKKIERTRKSDGKKYYYSEGKIAFPDNLDVPARTMLTSESTINRSSHVVKDIKTGKLRTLTPVEAERIQMFPDNWTNIKSKSMTKRRRYFLMGNALVVGIVERLAKELEEIVNNE